MFCTPCDCGIPLLCDACICLSAWRISRHLPFVHPIPSDESVCVRVCVCVSVHRNRRGGTSFTNELYGRLQECFSPYRVPRSKLLTKIKKFFSRKQESATSTPSDSPPPPTASASSPVLPPDPKRLSPFIMDLTADSPGSPP